MTSTSYSVFGVSMERQIARRKLVALVYTVLAVLCAVSILFARTEPLVYSWTLYATMGVSIFVFGGQGRYGLIKPFPNKPPRPEPVMVDVVRLQLAPMMAGTPDDANWKNDERELSRRDRAHYQAYSTVGLCLLAILLLAALGLQTALGSRHLVWLNLTMVLQMIFAIAMAGSVLMVTLPAAIILWTEPDIDLG